MGVSPPVHILAPWPVCWVSRENMHVFSCSCPRLSCRGIEARVIALGFWHCQLAFLPLPVLAATACPWQVPWQQWEGCVQLAGSRHSPGKGRVLVGRPKGKRAFWRSWSVLREAEPRAAPRCVHWGPDPPLGLTALSFVVAYAARKLWAVHFVCLRCGLLWEEAGGIAHSATRGPPLPACEAGARSLVGPLHGWPHSTSSWRGREGSRCVGELLQGRLPQAQGSPGKGRRACRLQWAAGGPAACPGSSA